MILKVSFFLFLLFFFTASDHHYGIELSFSRSKATYSDNVTELAWMYQNSFEKFLEDEGERVSDEFRVSKFFYPTVNFWFLIYTQFSSHHVIIHDKNNLSLIYKVLDFSNLISKNLPGSAVYILKQKLTKEKISELKSFIDILIENPFSLGPEAKTIYGYLKSSGVKIPINKRARKKFFIGLKENMRSQTGQRNFIKEGIVRSLPFKPFLQYYFLEHKLPKELLAIPFLESSFNPMAESKAGALGAWQFMPHIANYYLPKRSHTPVIDYRSNVGVISIAAAILMKQNFQIMRSWDLAVTAYNSGTKHLLKTKRELSTKISRVNLEHIVLHSDSEHFGFASKNFYSEFLALVHALAYEEELFHEIHENDRYNVNEQLEFYLTKCPVKLQKLLTKKQLEDVSFYNHHILNPSATYPRATIVTTKENLPSHSFLKLKNGHLFDYLPKEWSKLLRNQSCSTR
jgi:membrane-bound lytic murein transglycosylase D